MKIQCDVCQKKEAIVFCAADEAALCECCDRKVHHANKLAGKHPRFPLLHPSFKDAPRCDICQERRAFLFCREDRAILCRECDVSIHRANEHTQRHSRFLLTGVKLSSSYSDSAAATALASSSSSSTGNHHQRTASTGSELSNYRLGGSENPSGLRGPDLFRQPSSNSMNSYQQQHYVSEDGSMSMSTTTATMSSDQMSEMLMEFRSAANRGWRLEDFVESAAATQRQDTKMRHNTHTIFFKDLLINGLINYRTLEQVAQ
ncbi:B-box zinc finger protein 20-like protein [Drosera capensis]